MNKLKKSYPLVVAPNALLIPHPKADNSVDLPEDVITPLFRGDWFKNVVVVAPSNEIPTLATVGDPPRGRRRRFLSSRLFCHRHQTPLPRGHRPGRGDPF